MTSPSTGTGKAYYRIGEVGRICGIKTHVLRYWESEFTGLNPVKSGRGQRLYTPAHIERIMEIKRLLHEERYTIEGARNALGIKAPEEATLEAIPVAEEIDEGNRATNDAVGRAIEGLKAIKAMLERGR